MAGVSQTETRLAAGITVIRPITSVNVVHLSFHLAYANIAQKYQGQGKVNVIIMQPWTH